MIDDSLILTCMYINISIINTCKMSLSYLSMNTCTKNTYILKYRFNHQTLLREYISTIVTVQLPLLLIIPIITTITIIITTTM